MTANHPNAQSAISEKDIQLREAMETYLEELEAGSCPEPDEFVTRYPAIAAELRQHLTGLDFIHLARPKLVQSDSSPPLPDDAKELGDFRLICEIGRGGMGVVYEAEQMSLKRRVAVKILPFAALLDQRQLERFRNEARAAAMLKHSNIVSVHSVGCERSVHFYAMELVEGRSMAELLEQIRGDRDGRQGPSDSPVRDPESDPHVETQSIANLTTSYNRKPEYFRQVASLGIQLSEALQYAHEQGVVHRDIKPSNLMIDDRGKPWITDFGLAQIQGDNNLTMTGDVVGTLRYMSPEQAGGKKLLDHRTDIYSLGISLYEWLTMRPAFVGSTRPELLIQVMEDRPKSPRQLDASIPGDLETIVLKAIAREPEARYDSAAELADDLQRFLHHKPIKARRTSSLERIWRWARHNRMTATLVSSVMLLLVVLAIGGPILAIRLGIAREDLRRQNYVFGINSAHAAYSAGNLDRAQELLNRLSGEDDLKEFSWRWLWAELQRINGDTNGKAQECRHIMRGFPRRQHLSDSWRLRCRSALGHTKSAA